MTADHWKNFNIIEDVEDTSDICNIGTETILANNIYSISGKCFSTPQKGITSSTAKKS